MLMLLRGVLMLLRGVLMAVFMEKNTPKNSTNSSKPASQTPKDETALSRAGTHSKGKAYDETRSANTRTVQIVQVSKASFCEECGEDLREVPCQGHERRTQIDIVFEKVVTHVDAEIKVCPNCEAQARGAFPLGFSGPPAVRGGHQHSIQTLIGQPSAMPVGADLSVVVTVVALHAAAKALPAD